MHVDTPIPEEEKNKKQNKTLDNRKNESHPTKCAFNEISDNIKCYITRLCLLNRLYFLIVIIDFKVDFMEIASIVLNGIT